MILVDVLRGAQSKRITNAELDKIPEYGRLGMLDRESVVCIVEWLLEHHYILKTKHPKYPVLHPTYEGMHYKESITEELLKELAEKLKA